MLYFISGLSLEILSSLNAYYFQFCFLKTLVQLLGDATEVLNYIYWRPVVAIPPQICMVHTRVSTRKKYRYTNIDISISTFYVTSYLPDVKKNRITVSVNNIKCKKTNNILTSPCINIFRRY